MPNTYTCYVEEVYQDIEDDEEEICLMIVPRALMESAGWKQDEEMTIKLESKDGSVIITPFYD